MYHLYPIKTIHHEIKMGHCPKFTIGVSQHFPNQWGHCGARFSVISHVQRPVHRIWHTEIISKSLRSCGKVMSHRSEASVKHDRKVCDVCPIITPLDYMLLLSSCFNIFIIIYMVGIILVHTYCFHYCTVYNLF